MFLVKEESKTVMAENNFPSAAKAIKVLGERWQKMSDTEKSKYVKMSEEDRIRHETQMKEYLTKGTFTLEDGTDSSTLKPKKKLVGKKRPKAEKSQAEGSQDELERDIAEQVKKRQRKNWVTTHISFNQ